MSALKRLIWVLFLIAFPANAQIELVDAFPDVQLIDPIDIHFADRVYVTELDGRVVAFDKGHEGRPEIVLDITGKVSREADGGLLSSVVKDGDIYVHYTATDPLRQVIERYPDGLTLLEIPLSISGHNGGGLVFDGDYLYIAIGDGNCCAGDSLGNAQNTETLTGAVLRIEPTDDGYRIPPDNPFVGTEGRDEIYAYGFRNPWRMAIDDGNLWVSDVGQLTREEVNIVEKGKNYGWNILEGTHCYTPEADCAQPQFEEPEIEYGRETGRCVTGGHVHRGAGSLHGKYIFGDWSTGRIWSYNGEMELLADTDYHIGSFARDEAGDVYAITIEAKVLKVTEMDDLSAETPNRYTMKTSAYPTPFSGGATIEYSLESPGRVTLEVYDALGRRIGAVDEGMQQAGIHRIEWRGESVGVYYYRVLSGSESGGGVLIKAQ